MKLKNIETGEQPTLSDELLWTDEYAWVPPQATKVYSLTVALLTTAQVHLSRHAHPACAPAARRICVPILQWLSR